MFERLAVAAAVALLAAGSAAADDVGRLNDPMQPYAPEPGAEPQSTGPAPFTLNAVLVSSSRRVAVINGEIRREGDRVGDATVTRIEPRRVALRRGGEEIVVRLPGGDDLSIRSGDDSR